jgi:hypothetical protein
MTPTVIPERPYRATRSDALTDRNQDIIQRSRAGENVWKIARRYSISRARVYQICGPDRPRFINRRVDNKVVLGLVGKPVGVCGAITMSYPQSLRCMLSVGGVEYYLPPTEHRILETLLLNRGRVVERDDIIEYVWPNPDAAPQYERENLRVHLARMNKRLPGLIRNEWGRGWCIPIEGRA